MTIIGTSRSLTFYGRKSNHVALFNCPVTSRYRSGIDRGSGGRRGFSGSSSGSGGSVGVVCIVGVVGIVGGQRMQRRQRQWQWQWQWQWRDVVSSTQAISMVTMKRNGRQQRRRQRQRMIYYSSRFITNHVSSLILLCGVVTSLRGRSFIPT